MEDDLKNKNSEAYKQKLKLAMSAFESGCIIYSQDTCRWLTPREFMESDERVVLKGDGLEKYSNFTLIYPKQAIERNLEDLRRAQTDFDAIMKKVLTAFEISPMDPKTKRQ
jgi:hypothetical protein